MRCMIFVVSISSIDPRSRTPSLFVRLTPAIYPWKDGVEMSRPQFVLEDDDTEDQRLRSSELPRYSEDSIDELALDRSVFEKDERFRDEGKMEQGEEEEDGFLYGKVPVSDMIKVVVSQTDILIRCIAWLHVVTKTAQEALYRSASNHPRSRRLDRDLLGEIVQSADMDQERGQQAHHHGPRV